MSVGSAVLASHTRGDLEFDFLIGIAGLSLWRVDHEGFLGVPKPPPPPDAGPPGGGALDIGLLHHRAAR